MTFKRYFQIYSVSIFFKVYLLFQCYIKRNFLHFLTEKELLFVHISSQPKQPNKAILIKYHLCGHLFFHTDISLLNFSAIMT